MKKGPLSTTHNVIHLISTGEHWCVIMFLQFMHLQGALVYHNVPKLYLTTTCSTWSHVILPANTKAKLATKNADHRL